MAPKPAKKPQAGNTQPIFEPNANLGTGRFIATDVRGSVWLLDSESGRARKIAFDQPEEK